MAAVPQAGSARTAAPRTDIALAQTCAAVLELSRAASSSVCEFDIAWLCSHMDQAVEMARLHRSLLGTPALREASRHDRPTSRLRALGVARLSGDPQQWHDHLAHELVLRMLAHLHHDHWRKTLGYVDQPQSSETDPAVLDAATLARWGLDDAALEKPPSADGRPASPGDTADAVWHAYERHFIGITAAQPADQRVPQLRALFEQAWAGGYRGHGVDAHFAQQADGLFAHTDAVVTRVEGELLSDWRDGRRTLHGCARLVAGMVRTLALQADIATALADKHRAAADHLGAQLIDIEQRHQAAGAGSAGPLSRRLFKGGSSHQQFDVENMATLLRERAIALTKAATQLFVVRHVHTLNSRLADLQHAVEALAVALAARSAEAEARARDNLPTLGSEGNPLRRELDTLRKRLCGDRDEQAALADRTRLRLFEHIGPRPDFRRFALEFSDGDLAGVVLAGCRELVHTQLAANKPADPWALLEEWRARQPTSYAIGLRSMVSHCLQQHVLAGEMGDAAGTPRPPFPRRWVLALPARIASAPQGSSFDLRADIVAAISDVRSSLRDTQAGGADAGTGAAAIDVELTDAAGPQVSLYGVFDEDDVFASPRMAELQAAYERVGHADPAHVPWLHVHAGDWTRASRAVTDITEVTAVTAVETAGAPPPADTPSGDPAVEPAAQARRLLLLALAQGVVDLVDDANGGEPRVDLIELDADGFELDRHALGQGLAATAARLDHAGVEALRRACLTHEHVQAIQQPDRHDALRASLREHIDKVRSAAPVAERPALSLAWNDAARAIMRFARKESSL